MPPEIERVPIYICIGISGNSKSKYSILCLYFGDSFLYASEPCWGDDPWLYVEEKHDFRRFITELSEFSEGPFLKKPPEIHFRSGDERHYRLMDPPMDMSFDLNRLIKGDRFYMNEGDSMLTKNEPEPWE